MIGIGATALLVACSSTEPAKTGSGAGGQAGTPATSSTGGHPATGGSAGSASGGAGDVGGGAAGRAGTGGAAGVRGAAGATGNRGDAGASGAGGIGGTGGTGGNGAVVVAPVANGKQIISGPYTAPPEATRMAGVPQGMLDTFTFNTSTVFPNTSRQVDIFTPAQYVAGTEVPFMVIQDGVEQLTAYHTNIVLENLIHQKRLPVMAAIFVDRPDNGPERSLEYDCLDDDYARFIATDILPVVQKRHPDLKLTSNPDGRGSLGKSSGGPAAFTLGWRHPDLYRRILTLNGSFVNLCKDGPGANTYANLVQTTDPAKPLRVYMFSGSNDNGGFAAGNQALADALQAKGYAWRYVYGNGASHDNKYASSMIVEALLWTWAGYPL
ncbi:MAG: alpha/beta hydrolase-fold protein [Verrucomicrobiota bacterium]